MARNSFLGLLGLFALIALILVMTSTGRYMYCISDSGKVSEMSIGNTCPAGQQAFKVSHKLDLE